MSGVNNAGGTRLGVKLALRAIEDLYIREAFQELQNYINEQDILRGVWRKFSYSFDEAGTFTVSHDQKFIPCDFIITGLIGDINNATINYNTVDSKTFEITVDGKGTVRGLLGNVTDYDIR